MIDIDKQIAYWRRGAQEDWIVARELVDSGQTYVARAKEVFQWLMRLL